MNGKLIPILAAGFLIVGAVTLISTARQQQSQTFFADHVARPDGTLRPKSTVEPGPGGWGATVIGRVEYYIDGEWQPRADCSVRCEVALFDADHDDAVTLADFRVFQNLFTGP